jgi:hypothetical protein
MMADAHRTTRLACRLGLVGVPLLLAGLVVLQLTMIPAQVSALAMDFPLCTTGALHNRPDVARHRLIRDFSAVRLLLNDPADRFGAARNFYEGVVSAPPDNSFTSSLTKRADGLKLLSPQADRIRGSLRWTVQQIDSKRGLQLEAAIDKGFRERDRLRIERGLRQLFSMLMVEGLAATEERLAQASVAQRTFSFVRDLYSSGIEAHLVVHSPSAAVEASRALDTMRRIQEGRIGGGMLAFGQERERFISAVKNSI